jgi:hypothetical protein
LTSTGAFTPIASVDYPGNARPLVPGSAYLNGTLYVMDFEAGIYGSAINDAQTWDPLNFIRAQIEPDSGVAIAKQASYVVAFKTWTTEFFYDAGAYNGTLTGSPLLPVQNAKLPMGCVNGFTVQSIDDVLYFVGRNKTIGPGVYAIGGAKLSKISTPAVDKLLATYPTTYSWQIRLSGHTFYVTGIDAPTPLTLVFDITSGVWQFWEEAGTALNVSFSAAGLQTGVTYLQGTNGAVLRGMSSTVYFDTSPPSTMARMTEPLCVPQSCSVTAKSCTTSHKRRVR